MTVTIEDKPASKIFNVPNQLTTARLVLSIIVFVLIPFGQYHPRWYLAALIVFGLAASTDWVDGYWARRYGQVTKLGRIFDPFVDKIIICGTFIFLAVEMKDIPDGIRAWMAVVVVGREMLVTGLRSFIERSGGDFSASMAGKAKMVLQCLAASLSLVTLWWPMEAAPAWLLWSLFISVWAAVITTIYSGVDYIRAAVRLLRD